MSQGNPNVHRTRLRTPARVRSLFLRSPPTDPRAVDRVYVYFDKLLTEGPLIESWWFLRVNSFRRVLSNAVTIADYVRIDTGPDYFDPGPNRVRYQPVNPDLRDIDDLLVAPFAIPVTVI
jgi:hypothetical protein